MTESPQAVAREPGRTSNQKGNAHTPRTPLLSVYARTPPPNPLPEAERGRRRNVSGWLPLSVAGRGRRRDVSGWLPLSASGRGLGGGVRAPLLSADHSSAGCPLRSILYSAILAVRLRRDRPQMRAQRLTLPPAFSRAFAM